ncbi:MAG TPA: hypothetical protein VJO34_04020 [Methylomirabilota bacterium]|nr:hypothetical protein [Methylomirabilota bacterium]
MGLLAPVEIDDNIGKNRRILEGAVTITGAGGLLLKFHSIPDD